MKKCIAGLAALVVMAATAQTVILFDDGLQYTLEPNEKGLCYELLKAVSDAKLQQRAT